MPSKKVFERGTFLTSSPIPPGIEESKSSMESDIFIVNPMKLNSTRSNSVAKQFVDQSPYLVTDGGSEIQPADQQSYQETTMPQ